MTVTTTRARAAARRIGPRLARLAVRGARNLSGVAVALVLIVRVGSRPLLWSIPASQKWARLAMWAGDLLCRRGVVLGGVVLLGLAWLIGVDWWLGWLLGTPGLVWFAARLGMAIYPHTTRGRVRTRHGADGFLDYWTWLRHLSPRAARQAAATMRPSLATELPDVAAPEPGVALGQRARRANAIDRLPIEECGTWLGRTAVGPTIGLHCYVPHRDTCGVVAAPQTLKTAWLAGRVIDHPGAVVTTSTKPDVLALTGALRARRARSGRIEVFDPEHLSDSGSTFRWDPVLGCHSASVAAERAAALVAAANSAGGDDGRFWADAATRVLRSLLVAAALDGKSMREVYLWATSPAAADDALALLEDQHAHRAPRGWAAELRQLLHTDAKRTRESVWLTLSGAVAFMADAQVADLCCPGPDEPVFDVAAFLADHGTLYIIGSEREHSAVAPLLAVLTAHIFETAKHLAAHYPGGRLDPPLLLALDEVALIVPIPLDRWIADAGGRGITLIWSCQSLSQLAARWGDRGAETIFNATNAKLIPGGLSLTSDVETVSKLCGERYELLPDPDGDGPGHARFDRVPVLTPERVRTIPPWHAVLLHRSTPATIVRITPAWERHDVKRAGSPPLVRPIHDVAADLAAQRDPATDPAPVPTGVAA